LVVADGMVADGMAADGVLDASSLAAGVGIGSAMRLAKIRRVSLSCLPLFVKKTRRRCLALPCTTKQRTNTFLNTASGNENE
jgi:hypothetical protein